MGGCAVPDTSGVQDRTAERMVLCGILQLGREFCQTLDAIGFKNGDFYDGVHQSAYDLFCYVAWGKPAGPVLVDVYEEECRRHRKGKAWMDNCFAESRDFCLFLCECWGEFTSWHLSTWEIHPGVMPEKFVPDKLKLWLLEPVDYTLEGLAAAARAHAERVRWLAARRVMIHTALEAIRDAVDPISDADEMFGRSDNL